MLQVDRSLPGTGLWTAIVIAMISHVDAVCRRKIWRPTASRAAKASCTTTSFPSTRTGLTRRCQILYGPQPKWRYLHQEGTLMLWSPVRMRMEKILMCLLSASGFDDEKQRDFRHLLQSPLFIFCAIRILLADLWSCIWRPISHAGCKDCLQFPFSCGCCGMQIRLWHHGCSW